MPCVLRMLRNRSVAAAVHLTHLIELEYLESVLKTSVIIVLMFLAWNHGDVAEIWSRIPVGPKSAWSHQIVTVLACHDAMGS